MGKRKELYDVYINSAAWAEKRRLVLERDKSSCRMCGVSSPKGLHVHHLTYERFMDERLTDLVTLCQRCHDKEHPYKPVAKIIQKKADKKARMKPGTCRWCLHKFDSKSYSQGGGWYCSQGCKKKAKLARAKVHNVNPRTLRERGWQAAIEEANWLRLGA